MAKFNKKKKSDTFFWTAVLVLLALAGIFLNKVESGSQSKAAYEGTGPGSAPTEPLATAPPTYQGGILTAPKGAVVGEWNGDNKNRFNNAATIITVGMNFKDTDGKDVPCRGWIVAIGTALQESGLVNLSGGDRDSLGLFQQRPSQGWGTPAQITDTTYASRKFYQKLTSNKLAGWQTMRLTDAAQKVQVSGYPLAYQKHRSAAIDIVFLILNHNGVSTASCPSKSNLQGL